MSEILHYEHIASQSCLWSFTVYHIKRRFHYTKDTLSIQLFFVSYFFKVLRPFDVLFFSFLYQTKLFIFRFHAYFVICRICGIWQFLWFHKTNSLEFFRIFVEGVYIFLSWLYPLLVSCVKKGTFCTSHLSRQSTFKCHVPTYGMLFGRLYNWKRISFCIAFNCAMLLVFVYVLTSTTGSTMAVQFVVNIIIHESCLEIMAF